MKDKKRIIVVGAGAAGMMAAIAAASRNIPVLLLERNEKAGKKVYITSSFACNINLFPCFLISFQK